MIGLVMIENNPWWKRRGVKIWLTTSSIDVNVFSKIIPSILFCAIGKLDAKPAAAPPKLLPSKKIGTLLSILFAIPSAIIASASFLIPL